MTEYVYDRAGLVVGVISRGTAVNTGALVDATGQPVVSATLASIRPPDAGSDYLVWRQYDAGGRLVREATSAGTAQSAW